MARSGRRVVDTPATVVDNVNLVVSDRLDVAGAEQVLRRSVDVRDGTLRSWFQRMERRDADKQQLFADAVAPRLEMSECGDDVRRVAVTVVDAGGDDDGPDVGYRSGLFQDAADVVQSRSAECVHLHVVGQRHSGERRAVGVGHYQRPDIVSGDVITDPPCCFDGGLALDYFIVRRATFGGRRLNRERGLPGPIRGGAVRNALSLAVGVRPG